MTAKTQPLSFAEANKQANAHLHLIGENFSVAAETYLIEQICVAPYDEVSQHLFLLSYEEKRDLQLALQSVRTREYDVVIIGSNVKSKDVVVIPLSKYINVLKNNIFG